MLFRLSSSRFFFITLGALFLSACGTEASSEATIEETAPVQKVENLQGEYVWEVDPTTSRLSFTGSQQGAKFTGQFEKFDAAIQLNPDDLSTASISVSIDMSSAKTGSSDRDSSLPTKDWFAVKTYPTAQFQSTDIRQLDDGSFVAEGALTIKDVTQNINLPFTLNIEGTSAIAEGAIILDRSSFGVGEGDYASDAWIDFKVDVAFMINATR